MMRIVLSVNLHRKYAFLLAYLALGGRKAALLFWFLLQNKNVGKFMVYRKYKAFKKLLPLLINPVITR